MAASLEGLSFNVGVNVDKDSAKTLAEVANGLAKLGNATKKLANAPTAIKNVADAISGIDVKGASNVERVTKAVNALSRVHINNDKIKYIRDMASHMSIAMAEIGRISEESIKKLERISTAMGNVRYMANRKGGVKSAVESVAETSSVSEVEGASDAVGYMELPKGIQLATSAFAKLKEIGGKTFGFIKDRMVDFGKYVLMSPVNAVKRLSESFGKLKSSIGRILMYRAIRAVLSEISKGIQEGIKNLYQWSAVANGTFKSSMDGLASSAQYLGNSVAAMASPLINAVEPIVMRLVDDFVMLLNVVNQVFAALGGGSTFTLAKRTAKEYADTVGKAAGGASKAAKELKRTILGFDELNVLNDPNTGGGGGGGGGAAGVNYGEMFETKEVSSGVKSWIDALKNAFAANSGWEAIGMGLAHRLNEIVESIDTGKLGDKVGTVINGAIGIAYGFLEYTNFIRIGEKISDFINHALDKINFRNAGALLVRKFTALLDTIIGIVTTLDWGLVGKSISDFINGALGELSDWFGETDFGKLGDKLARGLVDMVSNIDIGEMIGNLVTLFANILIGIGEFVWGFGKAIGSMIIEGITSGSIVNKLKEWLVSGLSKINDLAKKLGIDLHLDAFIEDVKSSLSEDDVRKEIGANDVTAFLTGTTVAKKVGMNDLFAPGTLDPSLKIKPVKDDPVWKNQGFDQWAGISGIHNTNVKTTLVNAAGSQTTLDKSLGTDKLYNTKTTLGLVNSSGGSTTASSALGISGSLSARSTLGLVNGSGVSTNATAALGLSGTFKANTALGMILSGGSLTTDAKKWLGLDKTYTVNVKTRLYDSSITGGAHQALGGVYSNGKWSNIPQFAGGGAIRGSHFIAGEAGAELVGHIGGRSEVLNASQLASIMYRSVVGGMTATSGFWESVNATMIDCTNGVIRQMYDSEASDKGNDEEIGLLRRQNEILTQILNKEFTASVSIDDINTAQRRRDLRNGVAMA